MSQTVLEMRKVSKRFPGVLALHDVNIELQKGEILGVCGENGAGKTTLMKILSGSYKHGEYDGDILIDGKEVIFNSVADAQAYGIEMVYQEMNMMLDASVSENLFVGKLPGKGIFVNSKELLSRSKELLSKAKLDINPKMTVRPLNSGQMQLLSLMRACAKNPKIFVLDEPTSALTDQEVDTLMEILEDLRDSGVSCIYISHKLEELFRICNRVVVMRDGKVISCREIGDVEEQLLIEEMVGRKVETLYPKQHHATGEEVMRVENLSVPHPNIKGKNIVENISFSLQKGEILGIGGLVGAGRSEILGALFGQFTKGVKMALYVKGKKVNIASPKDAISNGFGFVTEERKANGIISILSIRENMSLANLPKLPRRFFIDKKVERKWTQGVFDRLGVKAPSLETKVRNLSGGNQQKVVIGKWLLNNPDILLVDEPTKGIDVGAKAEIYKLMGDITLRGASIIMVSSDMPELIHMSDRCIVVSNGKISGEFSGVEITDSAVMKAAIK